MYKFFKRFKKQEDGAVTSDWVVLTASVIIMVLSGLSLLRIQILGSIASIFGWVGDGGL